MKIYVCEDNALVAMMIEDLVVDLGHDCAGVADASGPALRGCEATGAELALVDLDLADGPTGLTLVADLAARGVPAIIVSGQAGAVPSGHRAAALVTKPIDEAALAAAIASVERGGGAERRRRAQDGAARDEACEARAPEAS